MADNFIKCDDNDRCELLADDFFNVVHGEKRGNSFNRVIADVADVYPDAILIGAIAAAKYIREPVEPRMTYDVDILLPETDFEAFLCDEIPAATVKTLEKFFSDSDSPMHSLKHKATGIYVDFLSVQSKPVKKKIIRYILSNRKTATNILKIGDARICIVRPEILIVMKLQRYFKNSKTEKGLSDHLDIIKILKTFHNACISLDRNLLDSFLEQPEIKIFETISADVNVEMTCDLD